MNNLESILYPALMLIAGIALSLGMTQANAIKSQKFASGGIVQGIDTGQENFEPPSGSGKGTPNRANVEKARSPCSSFGDVLYELGSKGGIQKRQSAGTL